MTNVPSPVTMASGSHASLTGKVRTAALGASDVKWLCLYNRLFYQVQTESAPWREDALGFMVVKVLVHSLALLILD